MKRYFSIFIFGLTFFCLSSWAWAGSRSVEEITEKALILACEKLGIKPEESGVACLTNAGSAVYQGQSTRMVFDCIPRRMKVSLGRGNLLPVHESAGSPLWFAWVAETTKPSKKLMMVLIRTEQETLTVSDAVNVYVDKGTSFDPFKQVLGEKAFALVTFANGWADQIPDDLMVGSLFHDHLCCGVSSGYFTVDFIRKNIPLRPNEAYTYIGAPAWCQDDYIMTALNLTPGKHGYVTMVYPYSRPWKTVEATFEKLGGIIIRFDRDQQRGSAHLLSFDWHEKEFKAFLDMPDYDLNWKAQPWLHVLYHRYLMTHGDDPGYFVSIIRSMELKNKEDLDRLTGMGANPLSAMLGPDETWSASTKKQGDKP